MNLPHDMGLPFQLPPGAVAGRPGKFISKTAAEKIGPHEKRTQAASAKDFPPRWAADSSYATQPK